MNYIDRNGKLGKLVEAKTKYEFFIQTDNAKVVTVNLEDKERGTEYNGQSICHNKDEFNIMDGIKFAFARATKRLPKALDGFSIGDKVRVIEGGRCYSNYGDWLIGNVPPKYHKYWSNHRSICRAYNENGKDFTNGDYHLVGLGYWHNDCDCDSLGFIVDKKNKVGFIIDLEGIEKI